MSVGRGRDGDGVRTSYSKSAVSMIPAVRSENWPTSHPKKTGCPALICFTTDCLRFSISVFTSVQEEESASQVDEREEKARTEDRAGVPDVAELVDCVELAVCVARVVDQGE